MRDRNAPALIAEAVGTFLFFFVGVGSVVLGDYVVANGGTSPGLLGVALAHGLALAVLVSALGAVSGAHFNPAVTLAVWIMGKITPTRAVMYVVAQLIGAALAGFALRSIFPTEAWQPSAIGTPALGAGISPAIGITVEAVLTALLVFAVLGTAVDPRPEDRWPGDRAGRGGRHPDGRPADRRGHEPGPLVRPGGRGRRLRRLVRVVDRPIARRGSRGTRLPLRPGGEQLGTTKGRSPAGPALQRCAGTASGCRPRLPPRPAWP